MCHRADKNTIISSKKNRCHSFGVLFNIQTSMFNCSCGGWIDARNSCVFLTKLFMRTHVAVPQDSDEFSWRFKSANHLT